MLKILSQLRPRRVVVIRGSPQNTAHIAEHCQLNIGARVFTPNRGEVIDATTETHIYQVRLTEALISQLEFQKGKDAEVAWVDAQIVIRNKQFSAQGAEDDVSGPLSGMTNNATTNNAIAAAAAAASDTPMDVDQVEGGDDKSDRQILTLEPMKNEELPAHHSVFINELKLIDFKQILMKANINSEFSGGVLWCSNGTVALRRVDTGKVTVEGCLSEEYYKIRELLYEQYAIV